MNTCHIFPNQLEIQIADNVREKIKKENYI